jgi:putative ABC transport system permease protein
VSRILLRASLRRLTQHPWQLVLSIVGIALGVGVVTSIDLTNSSSRRAFLLSREAVAGRASHHIRGGPVGLPEDLYRLIRVELGVRSSAPVVEGEMVLAGDDPRVLRLMGVDPFAEAEFRPYLVATQKTGWEGLARFLTTPASVLMTEELAEVLDVDVGDTLRVSVAGTARSVEVLGLIAPADDMSRQALADLVVSDIATAQELLGLEGRLSRINLILPEDAAGEALGRRLGENLPPGVYMEPARARSNALLQMTKAFNLNLTALSLLALFVGMFLIFNTMTFSVLQRRQMIGTFRALGVTRREIFSLILVESFLLGILGTAVGLSIGIVLAQGLLRLVTQAINDHYFVLTVRSLHLAPLWVAKAVVLGLGATVISALMPAWEATQAPPRIVQRRSSEEEKARRVLPRSAVLGTFLTALGLALFVLPTRNLTVSLGALFAVVLGCTFWTPFATVGLMRVLRPIAGSIFGVLGRMSVRGVVTSLSRTAVAVAALMMAVSVTVGVGIMIDSLRVTVVRWLEGSLIADIYVAPSEFLAGRTRMDLDPHLVETLADIPDAQFVHTLRSVRIDSDKGLTQLLAIDLDPRSYGAFRFKKGNAEKAWEAYQNEDAVLVSEPYAYHNDLDVGSILTLFTDRGPRAFLVAGVFFDYGSSLGVAMMSRANYTRYWDDTGTTSAGVYLSPEADVGQAMASIRKLPGAEEGLLVRSNRDVLATSMEIFDRTFAVTGVLRFLATIVAFVGVLSALMALALEKSREFAILRANGLTPRQLWRLLTSQTALMGFASGLLSIPVGILLASILVHVINKRSFGWTLQMDIAPGILFQALILAVVAALLAGLYPAWKLSRGSPAMALRDE